MPMRDSDARWLERDILPLLESLGAAVKPAESMFLPPTMFPVNMTYSSEAAANATAQRAALATQLAETTAQVKRRLEGRQRPAGAVLGQMSRNPAVEHYSADVDGQPVPYINISRWPCIWHEGGAPEQVYPVVEFVQTVVYPQKGGYSAFSYEAQVQWDGDWCWTITVDNRLSFDFECREDVEMVLPILAQGMAVAAGFTSHGSHSFPANAHGPAVGLAPFTRPGS